MTISYMVKLAAQYTGQTYKRGRGGAEKAYADLCELIDAAKDVSANADDAGETLAARRENRS